MMIDNLALSYLNLKKADLMMLIERFKSAETILNASLYELTANDGLSEKIAERIIRQKEENRARARQEMEAHKDYGIEVLVYGTPEYPTLLAECCDAPLVLYTMGNRNLAVGDELWVSVIGTKSCTEIGVLTTEKLVEDIASYNSDTVIVSSLSAGIETVVHRTALKARLRAVAILACSLDKIPQEHYRELASEILRNGGTIVSEYPLGTKFYSNSYNERNRLVAGFSHTTILVEAPLESNTLNTAAIADSYSREVFAFPGRVVDFNYQGNNQLIKSGRAEMITSFEDVKVAMSLTRQLTTKSMFTPAMSAPERLIYDCLSDGDAHSDEELLEKTNLEASVFNSMISLMELNDLVVALRGRMYIKK